MPIGRPPAFLLLTGVFLAAGVLLGIWIGLDQVKGVASALDRVENLTLDWRFLLAGPRPAPDGVIIVAIDDQTLSEAGSNSPPREMLARIVRALAGSHPRAVALDIALLDPKDPDVDAELADALKSMNGVVAAIEVLAKAGIQAASLSQANWLSRLSPPTFFGPSTRFATRRMWGLRMCPRTRAEFPATFR